MLRNLFPLSLGFQVLKLTLSMQPSWPPVQAYSIFQFAFASPSQYSKTCAAKRKNQPRFACCLRIYWWNKISTWNDLTYQFGWVTGWRTKLNVLRDICFHRQRNNNEAIKALMTFGSIKITIKADFDSENRLHAYCAAALLYVTTNVSVRMERMPLFRAATPLWHVTSHGIQKILVVYFIFNQFAECHNRFTVIRANRHESNTWKSNDLFSMLTFFSS